MDFFFNFQNYQRHLTAKTLTNDELEGEGGVEGDEENVLPAIAGPVPGRRGRKRKIPIDEENLKPAKKDVLPPIPEVTPQVVSI